MDRLISLCVLHLTVLQSWVGDVAVPAGELCFGAADVAFSSPGDLSITSSEALRVPSPWGTCFVTGTSWQGQDLGGLEGVPGPLGPLSQWKKSWQPL